MLRSTARVNRSRHSLVPSLIAVDSGCDISNSISRFTDRIQSRQSQWIPIIKDREKDPCYSVCSFHRPVQGPSVQPRDVQVVIVWRLAPFFTCHLTSILQTASPVCLTAWVSSTIWSTYFVANKLIRGPLLDCVHAAVTP